MSVPKTKKMNILSPSSEFQFPQIMRSQELPNSTTNKKQGTQNITKTPIKQQGDMSKSSTQFFSKKLSEDNIGVFGAKTRAALMTPSKEGPQSINRGNVLSSEAQTTTKQHPIHGNKDALSYNLSASSAKIELVNSPHSPDLLEEDDIEESKFKGTTSQMEEKYGSWISGEKMMFFAKRYNRDFTNGLLERDKILSLHKLSKNKQFSNISNLVIRDFYDNVEFPTLKQLNLRLFDEKEEAVQEVGKMLQETPELKKDTLSSPNPFDFAKARKLRDNLMQSLKYSDDRKEVRVITKEMSKLVKKIIEQRSLTREEKVEKMQACYSEGMDTLLYLVGRECVERGSVLMKIWNSNLILLQTFLQVIIKERNELKHNLDGIVANIREEYQSKYDDIRNKYENTLQKYEKLLPEVDVLTENNKALFRSSEMLKKHLKKVKKTLKGVEGNYQIVLKELVHMKLTYESMTDHERNLLQVAIAQVNDLKRSSILAMDELEFLGKDDDMSDDDFDEPSIHGLLKLNKEIHRKGKKDDGDSSSLKRLLTSRFMKEPTFQRDQLTDTDDFYHGHSKAIHAVVDTFVKGTQTDAADYQIDLDENEFNKDIMSYSRERGISKKKMVLFEEEDYPVLKKKESLHIKSRDKKRKMTFGLSKTQHDFDEKNFAAKNTLTILELCNNFSKKLDNFYKELTSFSNQIDDKEAKDSLQEFIKSNSQESSEFLKIIYHRDKDRQNTILKSKIYVSEKDFELEEKVQEIKDWERKADKIVKKYDDLKFRVMDLEAEKEKYLSQHSGQHSGQHFHHPNAIKPVLINEVEEKNESETPKSLEKEPEKLITFNEKGEEDLKKNPVLAEETGKFENKQPVPTTPDTLPLVKSNSSSPRKSALRTNTVNVQPKIERSIKEKKTTYTPSPTNKKRGTVTFNNDEDAIKGVNSEQSSSSAGKKKQGILKNKNEKILDFFNKAEIRDQHKLGLAVNILGKVDKFFQKKKIIKNVTGQETSRAIFYFSNVKDTLKASELMPLLTILKIISTIYTDIIKQGQRKENNNPLYILLYDFMLVRYGGIRKAAEAKLTYFLNTCLAHVKFPKVRLFLKLLEIINEPMPFEGKDFDFYLECLMKLDDPNISSQPGAGFTTNTAEVTPVGLERALELLRRYFNNTGEMMKILNLDQVQNDLRNEKFKDEMQGGRYFLDLDMFMERIFNYKYEYIRGKYGAVFDALDYQNSKLISEWEYHLWIRVCKPMNSATMNLTELFSNEADWYNSDQDEKFMSFRRFAEICDENSFYSIQTFENFKKRTTDEYQDLNTLSKDWDIKFNYMKTKLIVSKVYSRRYAAMLNTMDKYFDEKHPSISENVMWMRYRICDEEGCIQILIFETDKLLPTSILLLNRLSKCFFE